MTVRLRDSTEKSVQVTVREQVEVRVWVEYHSCGMRRKEKLKEEEQDKPLGYRQVPLIGSRQQRVHRVRIATMAEESEATEVALLTGKTKVIHCCPSNHFSVRCPQEESIRGKKS